MSVDWLCPGGPVLNEFKPSVEHPTQKGKTVLRLQENFTAGLEGVILSSRMLAEDCKIPPSLTKSEQQGRLWRGTF
jgi:hypothetical protein